MIKERILNVLKMSFVFYSYPNSTLTDFKNQAVFTLDP